LKEERAERGVRARQKAATRERLLAAARRCFERGGYRGTVVADIVREAGVAHGTFYVHFTGVEGVADALLESFNEGLARRLGPVLAAGGEGPLEGTLREAAGLFLGALDEDRSFVHFYAERASSGLPREALATGINPPALEAIAGALAARVGGEGRPRLDLVAHGLLALWLRVGLRYALLGDARREDAEDVLVRMTAGALSAFEPGFTRRSTR
jgi:AcrR family transcriptional regulator